TLRDMIVPDPLRPMEAIPLCPITGFPLSAAFSPSAAGGLSAFWVAPFWVWTERRVGANRHFGFWGWACGLAFFEPMLAGDADFTDNSTFVLNFDECSGSRARGAPLGGGAPWLSRVAGAPRREQAHLGGDRSRLR